MVYFGARYYDPRIGRFITPDPLGMIDGPNVYVYCNNDPINFIDEWGLRRKLTNEELWNELGELTKLTNPTLDESSTVERGLSFKKPRKYRDCSLKTAKCGATEYR